MTEKLKQAILDKFNTPNGLIKPETLIETPPSSIKITTEAVSQSAYDIASKNLVILKEVLDEHKT